MRFRLCLLISAVLSSTAYCQDIIEFNTTHWKTSPESIVEFDGRTCLAGTAELNNTLFTDGVVEFDLWTDGTRSYPGFSFRRQSEGDFETFYIRTHRMGLYDDAVQYTPAYGGMSCWQLYYGEGYTTELPVMKNRWIHIRAEIKQDRANFYIDHAETPTLTAKLIRPTAEGKLGLNTWTNRTYISNFKLLKYPDSSKNGEAEDSTETGGMEWEISRLLEANQFDSNDYPSFYSIFSSGWEKVKSDEHGLVNISRYRSIEKGSKNCVRVRKLIYSEKDQTVEIKFGYSDAVKLFLNEKLIYAGDYAYQSRGNSFTGAIGTHDSLYLHLKKGLNEIYMVLREDFGGWGFIIDSETPLEGPPVAETLAKHIWGTPQGDLAPESAVYDPKEKIVYITNFDTEFWKDDVAKGYITKVSLDGEIISDRWVDNLDAPTGACLYDGKLYVAERSSIAEISTADATITKRYTFPDKVDFPNDLVVDDNGIVYITNTAGNPAPDIYRLKNGQIEPWLVSDEISNLNGIYLDGDSIVVGDCKRNLLQRVDLATKHISTIISMGSGVIDGVRKDRDGNFIVSLWRGELYKIDPSGRMTQILNTQWKFNLADIEYVEERNMVIAPAYSSRDTEAFVLE
jgi:sugar lactone lactonase YvrE